MVRFECPLQETSTCGCLRTHQDVTSARGSVHNDTGVLAGGGVRLHASEPRLSACVCVRPCRCVRVSPRRPYFDVGSSTRRRQAAASLSPPGRRRGALGALPQLSRQPPPSSPPLRIGGMAGAPARSAARALLRRLRALR
jgi:hypothetical protein